MNIQLRWYCFFYKTYQVLRNGAIFSTWTNCKYCIARTRQNKRLVLDTCPVCGVSCWSQHFFTWWKLEGIPPTRLLWKLVTVLTYTQYIDRSCSSTPDRQTAVIDVVLVYIYTSWQEIDTVARQAQTSSMFIPVSCIWLPLRQDFFPQDAMSKLHLVWCLDGKTFLSRTPHAERAWSMWLNKVRTTIHCAFRSSIQLQWIQQWRQETIQYPIDHQPKQPLISLCRTSRFFHQGSLRAENKQVARHLGERSRNLLGMGGNQSC